MFDVHCHIDFENFDNDRMNVIERALNENVKIITCAFGIESIEKTKKILNELNKKIFVSYGISPQEYDNERIRKFVEILRNDSEKIIGVGEIGLDYYWEKNVEKRKQQIENFKYFIEIAEKIKKPIIVHSRNAEKDVIEILKSYNVKAILHCFSGTINLAKKAIDLGCLISIPTSVCYSKSKMELVKNLEIENLVTETDAPFLSPFPQKNKRNEPLNIKFSIRKISELKNLDYDYVDEIIEKNVKKFFDIK